MVSTGLWGFPQRGTNRAWANLLESLHCFPALPRTLPPLAAKPVKPRHQFAGCAAVDTPTLPEHVPGLRRGHQPGMPRVPVSDSQTDGAGPGGPAFPAALQPTPHAQPSLDPGSRGCSLSHPLVAQAVALPVSRNWGRGEAASHRCVRTGGPPAEPRRTGAAGGGCEQSRESDGGAVEAQGRGAGFGGRHLARLSWGTKFSQVPWASTRETLTPPSLLPG